MSYNESYASYSISTYASGDTDAASTYGEVFVEHTSQDLEAACNGVTCYVACSCNESNGWYSTASAARDGDTNAQVYTVTSDIHYAVSSVSTSSLNDLTIATASTTALANQTPISRASTLSSLTIDAPTLKTASTSGTKATCYKKKTCSDMGYCDEEPDDSDYFTKSQPTNECYMTECNSDYSTPYSSNITPSTYFKSNSLSSSCGETCYYPTCASGAYINEPSTNYFATNYEEIYNVGCYRATGCSDNAFTSSPDTDFFITTNTSASGYTCYRGDECNISGGAYSIAPMYSFFNVETKTANTTCFRATSCASGAYSSQPNTLYFKSGSQSASDITCWRDYECASGAYETSPDTDYFVTSKVSGSTKTCYRATGCRYSPSSTYFTRSSSTASGRTCYRATGCADGYTETDTGKSSYTSNGITCYEETTCDNSQGYYDTLSECNSNNSRRDTYRETCAEINGCYALVSCIDQHCGGSCTQDEGYFQTMGSTVINTSVFEYGSNWTQLQGTDEDLECFDISCKDGYSINGNGTAYTFGDLTCKEETSGGGDNCHPVWSAAILVCEEGQDGTSQTLHSCTWGDTYACDILNRCEGQAYGEYYRCLGYAQAECRTNCNSLVGEGESCGAQSCTETLREACNNSCN